LAYPSNILLARKHWNWGWHCQVVPIAARLVATVYSDCRLQITAGILDWAKFKCTPIR